MKYTETEKLATWNSYAVIPYISLRPTAWHEQCVVECVSLPLCNVQCASTQSLLVDECLYVWLSVTDTFFWRL